MFSMGKFSLHWTTYLSSQLIHYSGTLLGWALTIGFGQVGISAMR